jgi:hypothetical protein
MWWWTQLHEAKTWANGELADTTSRQQQRQQAPYLNSDCSSTMTKQMQQ